MDKIGIPTAVFKTKRRGHRIFLSQRYKPYTSGALNWIEAGTFHVSESSDETRRRITGLVFNLTLPVQAIQANNEGLKVLIESELVTQLHEHFHHIFPGGPAAIWHGELRKHYMCRAM